MTIAAASRPCSNTPRGRDFSSIRRRYVQQLTGNRSVHTVLGGFHLLNADAHRLERTIVALRDLGIRRLGPAHCTGMAAAARFWTDFAGQCVSVAVGARLAFQR